MLMTSAVPLYARYFRRLLGYRFPLAVGILSDLFSTFLTMLPPLLSILIFDYAYPGKDHRLLVGAILVGLGIYFINFFFSSGNDYINVHIDQKLSADLAADMFRKTLRLPLSVQARRNVGDLTVRTLEDTDFAAGMILNTPQVLTIDLATLGLFLVISLAIDPYVTLLSLVSIPIYLWETHFFTGQLEGLQQETQTNRAETVDSLQERLLNLRTIKAFGKEREEERVVGNLLHRRRRLSIKQKVISLVSEFSNSITLKIWSAFVTGYMGFEVIRGRLSIGELIALGAYLPQLADPIHSLANLYTNFRVGMVSLRRVDEILSLPEETTSAPEGPEVMRDGHVRLQSVSFAYEPLSPVLQGISLNVPPRSTLAIVGPSGAGKSTLVNLLLRLHDPTAGMILVDGQEVGFLQLAALRSQIGVVFQEISLFAGTIRENIVYGRREATDKEVAEAAQLAAAHDFILRFSKGYDAPVERFGQNLSGGQKQRIALARALLMKPKILILDEAASALDAESEFLIQETVRRCRERMTVILVANRFSSVKGMDQIIVLDEGRLVEKGTFSELLARKGLFFTLYQLQTGGFEEFCQRLEIEFARIQRYRQDLSLILLQIGEISRLARAEKAGRIARLMEEVNLFVRRHLRIMDFSVVFKEDAILIGLPETSADDARNFALRVQQRISAQALEIDGKKFQLTASARVCSGQDEKVRYAEELIERVERMPTLHSAANGAAAV